MKLQKEQAKLDRKQARFEASQARASSIWRGIRFALMFLVNSILILVLVGATGLLCYYLVKLIRKSSQGYFEWLVQADHELKLEREYTKRLKYEFQPNKGMFEGMQLNSFTYSPRTADNHSLTHSYTQHHKTPNHKTPKILSRGDQGSSLDAEFSPVLKQLPTFNQALNNSPNQSLVLGYDETTQPIYGAWSDLFSFGVGGASGSGKTSTAIWLLAQAVRQGAKLIVIDPHAGNKDSLATKLQPLANSFLCNVATSPDEMLASINYAQSIFDARKSGLDLEQTKIILCIDEWLACMRGEVKEAFQVLAESISQEGRKYNFIGCFLSQKWSISKSGDMRDTLTAHIITRSRPNLARQQTGLTSSDLPSDVISLDQGQFYLLNTTGDLQKLRAPYVSQNDLSGIALSLDTSTSQQRPKHVQTTSTDEQMLINPLGFGSDTETPTETLTAEEASILQMFRAGKSISEITRELSGAKSGRKYSNYLDKVNTILRKELK